MLAIAGGIIIAVLVLSYLDVIISFGVLALLAIGAILLVVLLYQAAPAFTISLAIGAVLGGVYFISQGEEKSSSENKEIPKTKKKLAVYIIVASLGIFVLQSFIPNPRIVFGFLWGSFLLISFSLMPGAKAAEMMGELNLPRTLKIGFGVFIWWLFLFIVIFPVYLQIRQDGGVWGLWSWLAWILGIAGFLLSWIWVYFRKSALRFSRVEQSMNSGEILVKSGIASVRYKMKFTRNSASSPPDPKTSWLYLTNKRLIVATNQTVIVEIALSDISNLELSWSRILGLLPFLPNSFEITTTSGATCSCVVVSRRAWVAELQMTVKPTTN